MTPPSKPKSDSPMELNDILDEIEEMIGDAQSGGVLAGYKLAHEKAPALVKALRRAAEIINTTSSPMSLRAELASILKGKTP